MRYGKIMHIEDVILGENDTSVLENFDFNGIYMKIDGSPAIVAGVDDKGFFVSTKRFFNKKSIRCYSYDDIRFHFKDIDLQNKLRNAFDIAKKFNYVKGLYIQGDYMSYDKENDVYISNIIHYKFNFFPKEKEDFIVWHTVINSDVDNYHEIINVDFIDETLISMMGLRDANSLAIDYFKVEYDPDDKMIIKILSESLFNEIEDNLFMNYDSDITEILGEFLKFINYNNSLEGVLNRFDEHGVVETVSIFLDDFKIDFFEKNFKKIKSVDDYNHYKNCINILEKVIEESKDLFMKYFVWKKKVLEHDYSGVINSMYVVCDDFEEPVNGEGIVFKYDDGFVKIVDMSEFTYFNRSGIVKRGFNLNENSSDHIRQNEPTDSGA